MNALPIAASPPATPAPAPAGVLPGGRSGPTGATSSGSADTQDFAAAIGELAPRPATGTPGTPGTSGTSGASGATGVAAKTGKPKSTSVVRGDTAAAGTALTGIDLPLAGNLPPPVPFDMPDRANPNAGASGGDGDGDIDSIGAVEAASAAATVSSSTPIATADLSAVGGGPGIAAGRTNTFLRMFGDGIEQVPADLSAAAARVAGAAGTPMPSTEVGDAADRGHPNALGETAAPAGASSAAGVAAETTLVGANAGAEADVAALARSRSAVGTSLAVTAAVNERAGTAEIAAGTGATAGGGAGTGAADPAGSATVAASVGAGGQVTSAVAPARAAISAIAAALGGNGKHAQDLGGGAPEAASLAATAPDGASAAAQAAAGAPATEASAAAPSRVDAPISSPEFTQAIASRVSYLVDNNINGATLQVTPPQLGPIELRVTIEAGHAQVSMSAHNPATLDALQSGAPKLRELLSAQGFGQVSVDVSQRSFQDGSPYAQSRPWTPPSASDSTMTMAEAPAAARAPLGMLDAYA